MVSQIPSLLVSIAAGVHRHPRAQRHGPVLDQAESLWLPPDQVP
jgi:flagellar biosynthesis component FlhA